MCALHDAVTVYTCCVCCCLCMYCLWRQKSFSGLKCAFVDVQVLVSCSHPWEVNLWYFGQEAEEELK